MAKLAAQADRITITHHVIWPFYLRLRMTDCVLVADRMLA